MDKNPYQSPLSPVDVEPLTKPKLKITSLLAATIGALLVFFGAVAALGILAGWLLSFMGKTSIVVALATFLGVFVMSVAAAVTSFRATLKRTSG